MKQHDSSHRRQRAEPLPRDVPAGTATVTGWSRRRSGARGIALAGQIRPDLILLDIQLPQMDGYAVARELRKDQGLQDVPIVAVTSYAMVGDRERALEAGCSGYIEKPINPDTFMSEIEEYLGTRKKPGA